MRRCQYRAVAVHTMLVEDHIVLREGLRRSLEANGVSVVAEVSDGNEVLLAARQCQPDVVLMDLSLPGQDGIAATRQLKQYLPDIPGNNFDDVRRRGHRKGGVRGRRRRLSGEGLFHDRNGRCCNDGGAWAPASLAAGWPTSFSEGGRGETGRTPSSLAARSRYSRCWPMGRHRVTWPRSCSSAARR